MIITVSGKGGAGGTTIALSLAQLLAETSLFTCIADFTFYYPVLQRFFGQEISEDVSLLKAIKNSGFEKDDLVTRCVHECGKDHPDLRYMTIADNEMLLSSLGVTGDMIQRLLTWLDTKFDFVIADVSGKLDNEFTQSAIEKADAIVEVTDATAEGLLYLTTNAMIRPRFTRVEPRVVVNRIDRSTVDESFLKRFLAAGECATDVEIARAMQAGQMPKGKQMTAQLQGVLRSIAPRYAEAVPERKGFFASRKAETPPVQAEKRQGIFGGLFGRKSSQEQAVEEGAKPEKPAIALAAAEDGASAPEPKQGVVNLRSLRRG